MSRTTPNYCINCEERTPHAMATDCWKKPGLQCEECGHFNHPSTKAAPWQYLQDAAPKLRDALTRAVEIADAGEGPNPAFYGTEIEQWRALIRAAKGEA